MIEITFLKIKTPTSLFLDTNFDDRTQFFLDQGTFSLSSSSLSLINLAFNFYNYGRFQKFEISLSTSAFSFFAQPPFLYQNRAQGFFRSLLLRDQALFK